MSLFQETYQKSVTDIDPMFSLLDQDPSNPKQLPSFKEMFLNTRDITGYILAKEVLGSYDHLKKLLRSDWFSKYWEQWVEEMEVKLKAEALVKISELAQSDKASSFQAAKFLSDKGWEQKRGRPSKAEKAKALKQEAALTLALEDDMARVLTVVK
jgi:hypothetical protein|tara:strand:- start:10523 stop:10987 length:465 start_codon:yes stop_codon:yes gene_type:complete